MAVIARGNTVFFSFAFEDVAGETAEVDTATLTLVYPGLETYQVETLNLTQDDSDDLWKVTWNSSKARAGWVDYHAHALSGDNELTEDGKFKISANRASMQHDKLQQTGNDYDESVI